MFLLYSRSSAHKTQQTCTLLCIQGRVYCYCCATWIIGNYYRLLFFCYLPCHCGNYSRFAKSTVARCCHIAQQLRQPVAIVNRSIEERERDEMLICQQCPQSIISEQHLMRLIQVNTDDGWLRGLNFPVRWFVPTVAGNCAASNSVATRLMVQYHPSARDSHDQRWKLLYICHCLVIFLFTFFCLSSLFPVCVGKYTSTCCRSSPG